MSISETLSWQHMEKEEGLGLALGHQPGNIHEGLKQAMVTWTSTKVGHGGRNQTLHVLSH